MASQSKVSIKIYFTSNLLVKNSELFTNKLCFSGLCEYSLEDTDVATEFRTYIANVHRVMVPYEGRKVVQLISNLVQDKVLTNEVRTEEHTARCFIFCESLLVLNAGKLLYRM